MNKRKNLLLIGGVLILILIIATLLSYLLFFKNNVSNSMCVYDSYDKTYLKKDKNCVINFACTKDRTAFRDECGCGCKIKEEIKCENYSVDKCPSDCVVCPPCEICSSIKCQTKEVCENLGFNESWYNPPNFCKTRGEVCPEFYHQVCGWFNQNINCIKYPCAKEFSNECFACADKNILYWTNGECPK